MTAAARTTTTQGSGRTDTPVIPSSLPCASGSNQMTNQSTNQPTSDASHHTKRNKSTKEQKHQHHCSCLNINHKPKLKTAQEAESSCQEPEQFWELTGTKTQPGSLQELGKHNLVSRSARWFDELRYRVGIWRSCACSCSTTFNETKRVPKQVKKSAEIVRRRSAEEEMSEEKG